MNQRDVIEKAVDECEDYIKTRKGQCKWIMFYQGILLLAAAGCIYLFVYFFLMRPLPDAAGSVPLPAAGDQEALNIGAGETGVRVSTAIGPLLANTMIIALAMLWGIGATVLMASFRSFHRDIDRAQRTKIGFLRIRVAAEKEEAGYQGEVRKSLTEGAFVFPEEYLSGRGKKGFDLLPGHPWYELLKMILEAVEIKLKPKSGSTHGHGEEPQPPPARPAGS